ncbi:MAG: 23S rRNA (pseudouridine(1915)-N(3))-methyltransferase RlmH [Clostridia bacterium]|nr:23S rRNA (pseudouridine(1915)-N(3))-methyltransferase RlmH [Clostridia bacterium]
MLKITILCVGKLKEKYWRDACAEYAKRMSRFADFSIIEVEEEKLPDSPSPAQISHTLLKEGERLLAKVPNGSVIAAMCIEGKQRSSEGLAELVEIAAVEGASGIAFVIGGSWGLSDEVKKVSKFRLSMSEMTFPHQLARVMLCEQIYRAFQINSGGKYHK